MASPWLRCWYRQPFARPVPWTKYFVCASFRLDLRRARPHTMLVRPTGNAGNPGPDPELLDDQPHQPADAVRDGKRQHEDGRAARHPFRDLVLVHPALDEVARRKER